MIPRRYYLISRGLKMNERGRFSSGLVLAWSRDHY